VQQTAFAQKHLSADSVLNVRGDEAKLKLCCATVSKQRIATMRMQVSNDHILGAATDRLKCAVTECPVYSIDSRRSCRQSTVRCIHCKAR
jgi:hypothetical protein